MKHSRLVIDIGAYGWCHEQWLGGFYPEELPGHWQFNYYSNRFRTAVIPASESLDMSARQIDQLLEDIDEQFEFAVAIPESLLIAGESLAEAWGQKWMCLEKKLIGFILEVEADKNAVSKIDRAIKLCSPTADVHIFYDDQSVVNKNNDGNALLKNKSICFCATPGNIDNINNAQIAIVNNCFSVKNLKELAGFIKKFIDQNKSHRILYLYFSGFPPSTSLMMQAETIVSLSIPEN